MRVETIDTKSVIHLPAAPIVVTLPAPAVVPIPAQRECPAPNRKARTATAPELPAADHVYASPTNADWIVAWNDASIYHSSNGGASFSEVLVASGRVHGVAIDCFGHVIAARGTEIGVRDGASEMWHDLPGIELTEREFAGYPSEPPKVWIVGGGPDLVVVGFQPPYADHQSRVAISHDLGRSWGYRDLETEGFEGTHLAGRQHPDGRIDLEVEIVDCGGEWMNTLSIANGEVTRTDGPNPEGDPTREEEAAWRTKLLARETWRDTNVSTDAAGRRWGLECGGHVAILATGHAPECPNGGDNE
ncbi:MAG: hypothetical protein AB7T06_36865 [Kofleriaceae bacterium]